MTILSGLAVLIIVFAAFLYISRANRKDENELETLFAAAASRASNTPEGMDSPEATELMIQHIAESCPIRDMNRLYARLKSQERTANKLMENAYNLESKTNAHQLLERVLARQQILEQAMSRSLAG